MKVDQNHRDCNALSLDSQNLISINFLLKSLLVLGLSLVTVWQMNAEGTPQLAPNGSIDILGNTTTDVAALNIGNQEYSRFAEFNVSDANARLYITITDSDNESIYLGFSAGHDNDWGNEPVPRQANPVAYTWYVKDPAGNVIASGLVDDQNPANIQTWDEAVSGPSAFGGDYDAFVIDAASLPSNGDYYIEFEFDNPNPADPLSGFLLIDFWDITVGDASGPKLGRIWSTNWGLFAINDFGFPQRPFNGSFFVCAPDPANTATNYVTKIDFNQGGLNFRPGGFNVNFNSYGTDQNAATKEEQRKSIWNVLNNIPNPQYRIYLNDPGEEICPSASLGTFEFNGISNCDGGNEYCIEFDVSEAGEVEITLDFGDGNPRVERVTVGANEVGTFSYCEWDGRDNNGDFVEEVAVTLMYLQGEYHFPIYDAERLSEGMSISRVRPVIPGQEIPKLYYDDTAIQVSNSSNPMNFPEEPKDVTDGCDQLCHRWNNFTDDDTPGYGNLCIINTWWFSNDIERDTILQLPSVLTCELQGNTDICPGDQTTLEIVNTFSPDSSPEAEITSVSWDCPGIVDSNDSSVTVNAAGSYSATVTWLTGTGTECTSNCSIDVNLLPTDSIKIDTTVGYNEIYEFDGVAYTITADTIVSRTFTNQAGCESTETVCVIVDLPAVVLTCTVNGVTEICEGDSTVLEVEYEVTPAEFEADITIGDPVWSGPAFSQSLPFAINASGEGTYTVTIDYTDLAGNQLQALCEATVSFFDTENTSDTITVGCLEEYEFAGETYVATADTTLTEEVTDANGCPIINSLTVLVEIPVVSYECIIVPDDAGVCDGESTILRVEATAENLGSIEFISRTWSSNIIADLGGATAEVSGGDTYTFTVEYRNICTGETFTESCEASVDLFPTYEVCIDTIISTGQVIEINGQSYDMSGTFEQNETTVQGCDSTIIVKITEESTLLCYDFDDCKSIDYSRFVPKIAEDFDCAEVTASTFYRVNPQANGHSCTEGANGTTAVCISSLEDCNYDAGNEKSAIIDVVITPANGESVNITALEFLERAPDIYVWTNDRSGLNNYPTLYGVRVLKNGEEIYRVEGEATSIDWTQERFSFAGNSDFVVNEPAVFRFELLAYCTVGADSYVTAWDIEDLKVKANCGSGSSNMVDISGRVTNMLGAPVSQVEMNLQSSNPIANNAKAWTNANGEYAFNALLMDYDYQVQPELNKDFLRGVTTADLIRIQRHILGLDRFESPYQMIAADADRSNSITAIDILQLRKLILGVIEELPSNTSYRFAYSNQELSMDNPWAVLEESMIENVSSDMSKESFKAIKVGDVSLFSNLDTGNSDIRKNNGQSIIINVNDIYLNSGKPASVNFELESSTVEGLQFALDVSAFDQFELIGLGNYGETMIYDEESEELRVSFINPDLNETIRFELLLNAKNSAWSSDLVSFKSDKLEALGFDGSDLNENTLELNFIKSEILSSEIENSVSITPNPFNDFMTIDVNSVEGGLLSIELLDVSGKMLYRNVRNIDAGQYSEVINKSDLQSYQGLLIVRVNNNGTITTNRVISL